MTRFVLFLLATQFSMAAQADITADAGQFMGQVSGTYRIAQGARDLEIRDSDGKLQITSKVAKLYENATVELSFDRDTVQLKSSTWAGQYQQVFGGTALFYFDEEESTIEHKTTGGWTEYVGSKNISKREVSDRALQSVENLVSRPSRKSPWTTSLVRKLQITDNGNGSLEIIYANFEGDNTAVALHLVKSGQ